MTRAAWPWTHSGWPGMYICRGSRRITDAPRRTPAAKRPLLSNIPNVISSQAYGSDHGVARCPRHQPCCNRSPREGLLAGDPEKCTGVRGPHLHCGPRSLFGTFSRERKYAPRLVLPEKKNPPLIHIKSLHTLLTMWINRHYSPNNNPLKEGIISPFMEYNHEGDKLSTHQVEKTPPSPQSINPKKRSPHRPHPTYPHNPHPLLLLLLYNI